MEDRGQRCGRVSGFAAGGGKRFAASQLRSVTSIITNNMNSVMHLRRTQLLDAELGQPLAHVNRVLEALALDNTGTQATSERITRAVSIVDERLLDLVHGVLLDRVLALDGNQRGLGALGDDGSALALLVLLGQVGHQLGDLLQVLGLVALRLGPRCRLRLVADDVVPVRRAGVQRLLEELGDEGSRQRKHEDLVLAGGLLGELHDGRGADWEGKRSAIVCCLSRAPRLVAGGVTYP